jgi:hypothetical protein
MTVLETCTEATGLRRSPDVGVLRETITCPSLRRVPCVVVPCLAVLRLVLCPPRLNSP